MNQISTIQRGINEVSRALAHYSDNAKLEILIRAAAMDRPGSSGLLMAYMEHELTPEDSEDRYATADDVVGYAQKYAQAAIDLADEYRSADPFDRLCDARMAAQ